MLKFDMEKIDGNVLIIYNPNSGRGRGMRWAQRLEENITKHGGKVGEVFCSNSIARVYEFCELNLGNPKNFSLALIIGGDGTLSPWVDAMIRHDFRVPIYAFGRGTANDFATFLRTNRSIKRTAQIITAGSQERAKITPPRIREMDTLEFRHGMGTHPRYAINVACGGAFTNGVTNYSKRGKILFGKLAYMFKALGVACKMRAQLMKFTIDGKETRADVYLFLILNSPNAGSIRKINPNSCPWDGQLELVAFKKCGFWGKISLAFSGLFKRLSRNKHVLVLPGITFHIEPSAEPNPNFTLTDIDGNKGEPYPLLVSLSDKKAPFVVA